MLTRLLEIRTKIFSQIENAARIGDSRAIEQHKKELDTCENLIHEAKELENKVKKYEASLGAILVTQDNAEHAKTISAEVDSAQILSKKEEGRVNREKWVKEISNKGIILSGHGTRFSFRGKTIGIAYSNECRRNRWWLGLEDKLTDVVVLLCREKNGSLRDIIIPFCELPHKWNALSRHGKAVKFNVNKSGADFFLTIPGNGKIDVTKNIGAYKIFNGQ